MTVSKINKSQGETPLKKPSKDTSAQKTSWRLAEDIDIIDRPRGGCFLFNQWRFSPTRTEAPRREVEALIDKIKREGISHLDQTAVDFLVSNSLLISQEFQNETPSEKIKEEWQSFLKSIPFTIRINPNLNNIKLVLQSLETVLSQFNKSENQNQPFFQIKYIYKEEEPNNWLRCIAQIIVFVLDKVEREKVNFYVERPVEAVVGEVDQLLRFNRPSLIIDYLVKNNLSGSAISSLAKLTENGFRPHLTFCASEENVQQIPACLDKLLSALDNDGFTFSLIPQVNPVSCDGVSPSVNSALVKDIINLLDYCHFSDKFSPNQSWIYQDLRSRTIDRSQPKPFPCWACAGRAVYIDQKGHFFSCHKQAFYESTTRQKEMEKALSDPTQGRFGRSPFAREQCDQCSLRYFCGGVCDYAGHQNSDPQIQQHLFQIYCRMRKHTLLHFFEEATRPNDDERQSPPYRFISGPGRLEIVSLEQKEGANP
ncbi:SPASM domain-containing protein [Planctomycetota bacterium]